MEKEIKINGSTYRLVEKQVGNRHIVVVDSGWIFIGNTEDKDGRVYGHDPKWLFGWRSIGLDGVIENPNSDKVDIRKIRAPHVNVDARAELFRIPVADDWDANR